MEEKYYNCAYKHCLHGGEKVLGSSAVISNGKYYHWDCIQTRNDIFELRDIYINEIDNTVSVPLLLKVLNDLVFKYDQEIDFIRFALHYYSRNNQRIKSPFSLLYLRQNNPLKRKYEIAKEGDLH